MSGIKALSPSQSPEGEVEETKNLDLYTPDAEVADPVSATSNKRKRPSGDSAASASSKKSRNAAAGSGKNGNRSEPKSKPRSRPKPRPKPPTIIIGADTGTTHSGVSYAQSGSARPEPKTLTKWDLTNVENVKFPSAIKFADPKNIWGLEAKHDPDALRWFKLLLLDPADLDEETRNSVYLQDARDLLQASGKSAVDAVSIFLKEMFEDVEKQLKKALPTGTVNSSRFHVVFTVPAIWPESARQRMKEAVEQSGVLEERNVGETTFGFVSEPEAAALATISDLDEPLDMKASTPGIMVAGDTIVVVDCGGGTVDIITYKIIKPKPMAVREAVPGRGALCGGLFVAERFKELVLKKFGVPEDARRGPDFERDMQDLMTSTWEGDIRNQVKAPARPWSIRVPFSLVDHFPVVPNQGHPTITITWEEVKEVFRPTVEKIESLINSQIEAAIEKGGNSPKYVILAGGFGSSGYLYECLTRRFPGLQVLQGDGTGPWSAISRGAVLHGMRELKINSPIKVAVAARVSRESIGVACKVPYDEQQHDGQDPWFDSILQKNMVSVMKWHVERSNDIPINHKLSFSFTRHLDEPPKMVVFVIYKSLTDQASPYFDEHVTKAAEITVAGVHVGWKQLPNFKDPEGKSYKKLVYRIEMHCGAGATTFSIYHRGKKLAAENISLEYY